MTTALAKAIEKQEWPVVSLYLLLGVSTAASKLPPETLVVLLDMLGGAEEGAGDGGR